MAGLKRKFLRSRGHVEIQGQLKVSAYAQIGGNLTVEGDLTVDGPLLCLGRITVRGSLHAQHVIAGLGLEVSGNVHVCSIRAYGGGDAPDLNAAATWMAFFTPGPTPQEEEDIEALDWITDCATLADLEDSFPMLRHAIEVGADCVAAGSVKASGSVQVGGLFNPDQCEVTESIHAATVMTEGDLDCSQLYAKEWVRVEGNLFCTEVECRNLEVWNVLEANCVTVTGRDTDESAGESGYRSITLDNQHATKRSVLASLQCGVLQADAVTAAGSIHVEGAITCTGYLRANRSITSGGAITTGDDFGIFAGLDIPRSLWRKAGYVCAAVEPLRILTGAYRP